MVPLVGDEGRTHPTALREVGWFGVDKQALGVNFFVSRDKNERRAQKIVFAVQR